MNSARVAALLRELADAVEAEDERPAVPRAPKSQPRRTRAIVAPPGEADELTRRRAKALLREHGMAEVEER